MIASRGRYLVEKEWGAGANPISRPNGVVDDDQLIAFAALQNTPFMAGR